MDRHTQSRLRSCRRKSDRGERMSAAIARMHLTERKLDSGQEQLFAPGR